MSLISTGWRTPHHMVCFFQDSIRWWSRSSMRTQIAERKHIYVGIYTSRWVMHVVLKKHFSRIYIMHIWIHLDIFWIFLDTCCNRQVDIKWCECAISNPLCMCTGLLSSFPCRTLTWVSSIERCYEWALFFNDDDETLCAFAIFVVLIAGTC